MNKVTPQIQAIASRLSSAFKRRNNAPSITNPPFYNDDRQYRLSQLLSVVSFTLLLLLSIPALVLKAYSYSFIESNAEMGFYLVNDEVQGEPEGENLVAALPHNLFRVPEKLVLVVAMLNILLSMAHLAFVTWDWKAGRRTQTRAFRRNAMVLHIINASLVLTAFIAISVSHETSSPFKHDLIPKTPNAVSPSGYRYYRYDSGTFDLETWTCELENAKGVGEARKDYQAQCEIEVAGRTIMVPFFLVTLAIAGLSVWALVIGGKHGTRSEHLYTKDADLEIGNGAENGKQVQVEEVELATLEAPDRQKDARLSKIEEDGEETEEVSKESETTARIEAADALPAESKDVDAKKGAGAS